jgi:hypothetical protein
MNYFRINKILEIISGNPPLKKWSERKFKSNKLAFIHKIVKILIWASGGELKKMMFFHLRVKKYELNNLTRESHALNKNIPCINQQKHNTNTVLLKLLRIQIFPKMKLSY